MRICRAGPNAVEVFGDIIVNGKSLTKVMQHLEILMAKMQDVSDKMDTGSHVGCLGIIFSGHTRDGMSQYTTP